MIFKCKNCGGNALYHPSRGQMWCPHCEGVDCEEPVDSAPEEQCLACGAPLTVEEFTSAVKCEHCGSYSILTSRMQNEHRPALILPFQLTRQDAVEKMKQEFKKRIFTPDSFLDHSAVECIEGSYIPFWLYDYDADADYMGNATIVNTYTRGDYRYTETSHYQVIRKMEARFSRIPVDASQRMADDIMDLMEPYEFEALRDFEEKYVSGFYGEMDNFPEEELQGRAEEKVREDTESMLQDSIVGYTTCIPVHRQIDAVKRKARLALLPVWVYKYSHKGKEYIYHVNGQTGKVIGVTPTAWKKAAAYCATIVAAVNLAGWFLNLILEVWR